MPSIEISFTALLSALALSSMAHACAYSNYSAETGPETAHRFCLIGCGTEITGSDPNFQGCCEFPVKGQTVPSSCEALVLAATKTDCPTDIPTTASVAMSAPTDYKPGYPTAAPAPPAETSDTAGEAYSSIPIASTITTWVTETASPDCPSVAPVETTSSSSAETTLTPITTPPPAETTPVPDPACTCACPAPEASAPPPETSDTAGQSWSSSSAPTPTESSEVPDYAGSKPEGEMGNLDRRHDVAYTCACPAPNVETSDTAGQGWTSSGAPSETSTPAPEPTEDCENEDGSEVPDYAGDKPTEEIHDNDPAKRFIPLKYPIAHPLDQRDDYGPPPHGFVPDHDLRKRSEPTADVIEPAVPAGATTVTSTMTVTMTCPGDGATASSDPSASWTQSSSIGTWYTTLSSSTSEVAAPSQMPEGPDYAGSHPTEEVAEDEAGGL